MRFGPRHSPPAYRFAVTVVRPLLMSLTRRRWRGQEHLPRDRGFVAVSNHISHIDPFVFAHFLNDEGIVPHFLGKVEVFDIPVIGAVLRGAEQIPVYRETGQASDAFRAAVDAIGEGKCVAIYPEGTVTREPDLWPMRGKTGAARIALETGCPVIPIAQWGAQQILAPYGRVPHVLPRHTMQVSAGDPVDFDDLLGRPVTAEVLAEATERIMAALTSQLEVLRGETAPEGRFDPKIEGLTVTGRPKAVRPSDRSGPPRGEQPTQWPDDHRGEAEDGA
ncbi:lysophospholipid acyltransferase family protein [Knoellia subterranea]|uniref:Acyltransferase n=1 Tax=Knoellia subterranea KCTC 19937 TaxID=1385521 RepID=A0A0A0JIV1_9MICO|nr:lysophospholipid acyltransferase family protein [Knoellia subterranea]KGN36704.1 acyltransferase [Knoellia subterranea KCTC 19937]